MREWARGASALLVVGVLPVAAGAQDVDPAAIADEIVEALAAMALTATYSEATVDGDTVTITDLTLEAASGGTAGSVSEIVVVNPVALDEGGFFADDVTLTEGTITDGANVLLWDSVTLIDMVIPPEADLAAEAGPELPLSGATIVGLEFLPADAESVSIGALTFEVGEVEEGVPYSVTVDIDELELPMDIAGGSEPFATLQEMGFASLVMDVDIAGTFDAETDTLSADSADIVIRDFGDLEITGVFSGLALGMLQEPGGIEEVLAAAQVEALEAHFENGGAMDAFFRVQAELSGVAPEDVSVGLAFAFQAYLQTLENPELERQIGAAVGAFLRNPQTITLQSDLSEPVPLMEIVGLVLSAPTALPGLLDLVVTANSAE